MPTRNPKLHSNFFVQICTKRSLCYTALAKYIKNYWPHLEVTANLRTRYNIRLLVSSRGIQVAKTYGDPTDPLQICRAFLPVPRTLPFGQCASVFTTLQCRCCNCERDRCSQFWFAKLHLTMRTSYTVRPLKNDKSRGIK
jgi:hypothetical protein